MSTGVIYWGMPPSAAGDLGGQHLSQTPSPSGLIGVPRAQSSETPCPRCQQQGWLGHALREPKGKPLRMLPHCAAHRASQKPVLEEIQIFRKAEELTTDQRKVCSHGAHRFASLSCASLPDGFLPLQGGKRERVIYMSVLEIKDAESSSCGATPASKSLKDQGAQRS